MVRLSVSDFNFQGLLNFPDHLIRDLPHDLDSMDAESLRTTIRNLYFSLFFYSSVTHQLSELLRGQDKISGSRVFPTAFYWLSELSRENKNEIQETILRMGLEKIFDVPVVLLWKFEEELKNNQHEKERKHEEIWL